MNADPEERRVVLKDLSTESPYEAFLMVSTSGGSLNGSTIHFGIEPLGWYHHLAFLEVRQRDEQSVYSPQEIIYSECVFLSS